jgi:hypothetical protein
MNLNKKIKNINNLKQIIDKVLNDIDNNIFDTQLINELSDNYELLFDTCKYSLVLNTQNECNNEKIKKESHNKPNNKLVKQFLENKLNLNKYNYLNVINLDKLNNYLELCNIY